MTAEDEETLNPSIIATKYAEELFAEGHVPTAREIAAAIDVARAEEYRDASRAGIRAITKAQLEVIAQCIELVRNCNKMEVVSPGSGPRHRIGKAIKMMEAEHARLKGIDEYVPPERKPMIIAPTAPALPKGLK